jgi:cell wall-associated NlpC family hydrolase
VFRRPFAVRTLLATSLGACLVLSALAPAWAAPSVSTPTIRTKQAQLAAANGRLTDLQDAAEERYQQYLDAVSALDKTRAQVAQTEAELARATADLAAARTKLGDRADQIYRNGRVDVLELFAGTTSVEDFLARMDLLQAIGNQDADMVTQVRDARFRVEKTRDALQKQEDEQVTLRAQAQDRKIAADQARSEQSAYVASLGKQLKRLIASEQEHQRQLAELRARMARRAAASAAEVAKSKGADLGTLPRQSASSSDIVRVAQQYLGVPYVWGGTSPSGFDCSGLTQYVYAKCGISIPRTSTEQFAAGTHIPAGDVSALKAGDLVFFGTGGDPGRVHHVAIYIGNGEMLHAPATGDVVRISSLTDRIASRGDYVGGSRF